MSLQELLYWLEVLRLVMGYSRFDARVCPTTLHRDYWVYYNGAWLCLACLKFSEWIAA